MDVLSIVLLSVCGALLAVVITLKVISHFKGKKK